MAAGAQHQLAHLEPLSLAPPTCDLLRDNLIRVVANRAPSLLAQHGKLTQVAVGFGQHLRRGRRATWAALKLERLRHDRHDGMLGPHMSVQQNGSGWQVVGGACVGMGKGGVV